ncbi:MAG: DAK2 domain-containing protein [Eubacteriaceae bacterium]|nr:DAK2 domain-containing protein [Eubacteriaceae bacterium]MBR5995723.1 DAK2 domain-containing protein [Eubacteriaceae bacterium]
MAVDSQKFKELLESGYANLENNKQSVNDLNVFPVPDGDTGTNMALTMLSAVREAENSTGGVGEIALSVSSGALMGARGNSGVILSQLLRGFAKGCMGSVNMSPDVLAKALGTAKEAAYNAVMKPTEGTILTVARVMSEFAEANVDKYTDPAEYVSELVKAGEKALDETPEMLPVLKEAGVVDAGGAGLMCIMKGVLAALEGNPVRLKDSKGPGVTAQFDSTVNSDIKFAYCTELLIRTDGKKQYRKQLIDKLMKIGDSLLVIEDSGIIKIHVHSNEPWNVMKTASAAGEFIRIKIENMKEQHNEIFGEMDENEADDGSIRPDEAPTDYAVIAVSPGKGFDEILRGLGVNYIISGGQTMNPSTQQFIDIIEKTNARDYILLPNNKNIIMACNQARDVSKKNVHVLETKNMPQAITALMSFDPSQAADFNIKNMTEAFSVVRTAQVTFAVRDTTVGGVDVHKDDVIGIIDGEIVSAGRDVDAAASEIVDKLIEEPAGLVSLYYGDNVTPEEAEALKARIAAKYPEVDFEAIDGGQPLYYYIISAE